MGKVILVLFVVMLAGGCSYEAGYKHGRANKGKRFYARLSKPYDEGYAKGKQDHLMYEEGYQDGKNQKAANYYFRDNPAYMKGYETGLEKVFQFSD